MYETKTIHCRLKDGFNYVKVTITKDGQPHDFDTLVRSGSGASVFSAKQLGISTDNLPKKTIHIGWEDIEVYEAEIEKISIEDKEISGVDWIYVSDLESFEITPVLGNDYLGKINYHKELEGEIILELDPYELGEHLVSERRREYLETCPREQIGISLTDFFFIEDGMYPTDFELVLVIMKDGTLSAGCVERGMDYTEDNWRGIIHQSRGGVIKYEDILAWKPIEDENVFEDSIYNLLKITCLSTI